MDRNYVKIFYKTVLKHIQIFFFFYTRIVFELNTGQNRIIFQKRDEMRHVPCSPGQRDTMTEIGTVQLVTTYTRDTSVVGVKPTGSADGAPRVETWDGARKQNPAEQNKHFVRGPSILVRSIVII